MTQVVTMQLRHVGSLAGKGEQADQYVARLGGIAVDAEERLWAVGDREVKQFNADGTLEGRFATSDAGWCITAAGDSLWIGMQGAIEQRDRRGNVINSLVEPERLGLVTAVAVQGDVLFAADATHNTIHMYQALKWQREVGREANTRGFMIPNGILDLAIDAQREVLLVAHSQKHRVERYRLDGEFIDSFGRFGVTDPAGFGGCCNPTNVAVVGADLIATSVKAPPGVKFYTAGGEFVVQTQGEVFDPNTKNIDVAAADKQGRVYATDPLRCTIEVFELDRHATG